jgi:hypothetical protein
MILMILVAAPLARATVVDFNDIASPGTATPDCSLYPFACIAGPYGGLIWTPTGDVGWNVASAADYASYFGNTYATTNFAFNGNGSQGQAANPLTITLAGGGSFDFFGADFSTFAFSNGWALISSKTITVEGFSGDGPAVYSATHNLSPNSFTTFNDNFLNIDRLVISNDGGNTNWIMDNLTYSPVPEPTSFILLGTGLSGLAFFSRRKRN